MLRREDLLLNHRSSPCATARARPFIIRVNWKITCTTKVVADQIRYMYRSSTAGVQRALSSGAQGPHLPLKRRSMNTGRSAMIHHRPAVRQPHVAEYMPILRVQSSVLCRPCRRTDYRLVNFIITRRQALVHRYATFQYHVSATHLWRIALCCPQGRESWLEFLGSRSFMSPTRMKRFRPAQNAFPRC